MAGADLVSPAIGLLSDRRQRRPVSVPERDDEARLREFCHDLRQPVAAICMLVAAAAVESGVPLALRDRLELIEGEARRLRHLAEAMLRRPAVAVPAAAVPAPRGPADAAAVVGAVVASRRITTATPIRLANLASCTVPADPATLDRAVDNLLGNALRAAGDYGRVEVSTRLRRGWLHIDVEDDGPGFGSVPAGAASVGLGIVAWTAARYGGRLEFRARSRGGTRARLVLPVEPGARSGGP